MKIQNDLFTTSKPSKKYNFDKHHKPFTHSKYNYRLVPKHTKCHLCGEPVKYNYVISGYNYKIGNFVFCSWKCIQSFRRANGLIPKEVDYE